MSTSNSPTALLSVICVIVLFWAVKILAVRNAKLGAGLLKSKECGGA